MADSVFTRETLLDVLVNIVPLGILTFFFLLYMVMNPWTAESLLGRVLQVGLIAAPFTVLAVITYLVAKRIEGGDGLTGAAHEGEEH